MGALDIAPVCYADRMVTADDGASLCWERSRRLRCYVVSTRKYFSTFRTVVCSLLVGIAFWGTGIFIGTAATTSQLRMSVDRHVSGHRLRLLLYGTLAVAYLARYLGCQRARN